VTITIAVKINNKTASHLWCMDQASLDQPQHVAFN